MRHPTGMFSLLAKVGHQLVPSIALVTNHAQEHIPTLTEYFGVGSSWRMSRESNLATGDESHHLLIPTWESPSDTNTSRCEHYGPFRDESKTAVDLGLHDCARYSGGASDIILIYSRTSQEQWAVTPFGPIICHDCSWIHLEAR